MSVKAGSIEPTQRPVRRAGRGQRGRGLPRVFAAAISAVVLLAALSAAPAMADSATITVTDTAGVSDPAAGLPRVFTVSGTAAVPEKLFVAYRAVGGAPCAPTALTDTGTNFNPFYDIAVNGAFNLQTALTWGSTGPTLFCIWLAAQENTVTTPIAQTITFRTATGTISGTVTPTTPVPDQVASVTVAGTSEAPERVFATVKPGGGVGCAPTFASDTGSDVIDGTNVNGAFSVTGTVTQHTAGNYVICLWLASSSTDTAPIAGPQPVSFSVVAPPPPPPPPPPPRPCVVPHFGTGVHLATMKSRIRAGHCTPGKVVYLRSRRFRRGNVIRLSPLPGSQLAPGAGVRIYVSSGRPPRRRR